MCAWHVLLTQTLPFTWNCISPVECGSAVLGTLTKGNVNHPKGQEACIHDCLCWNSGNRAVGKFYMNRASSSCAVPGRAELESVLR